ncbi:phenylacetate--CoA ligase family protein [Aridibaculum aurantiacum]|uniref:phenylacetate--CoA ligase family protein n=1 Tax=Aridibaculum aurantiacum TaxID=2810307 RepID=UPI001A978485|nr:phenylacetate--CoA ligase family protein [Aridibaculum aurantiacum]
MSLTETIYNNSPVFLQNLYISAFGYVWNKKRFGGIFKHEHAAAKERENFTTAQWQHYQQQLLQKLLVHAYDTVPYYKKTFNERGLSRQQLNHMDLQQVSMLPVLSKDDLRKYGKTTLLSSVREKGGYFLSSSGSTGTPVSILYSPAMHQRWFGIYESRIRNWAGVSSFTPRGMIGGRRVITAAEGKAPFYRYNAVEKQVYFSAYHINAANTANYVKGIRKYGVQYMTGYAMSNFFLARFIQENNLEVPALKAVITSSEILTPEMRQLFQRVYNCKTYDSWGSVEACGIVSECEHGKLHLSPDSAIIEILDDDLQPVPAGVAGDVYCTGLLNFDQPLIRYKIGDRMVWSDERCACGREMPVIKEIVGRTEDVVIGKDGREMVRFHSVFYGIDKIKAAQVIQERVDEITVKIVAETKLSKEEENQVRQRVISQLGEMTIHIEYPASIPLTSNGKFQAVISKVKRKQLVDVQ